MAITLVASVSATPGATGGTSAAIDTTGATLLVMELSWYAPGGTGGPTDSKGNPYSALTIHGTGANARSRFFYCLAPLVGPGHTFTFGGFNTYPAIFAYAFAGVGSYQTESGAGAGASTSLASGSVTPSANGALIVTGLCGSATAASVAPVGFTLAHLPNTGGVNMQGGAAYYVQPSAAAIDPTWTYPSVSDVGVSTAVFLAASAPAAAETVQPYVWMPA